MADRSVLQPTEAEREARLELIRTRAQQEGALTEQGIRPPGAPFPQATPEHGYYNLPLLEEPQWNWAIPLYFFVGGAAGSSAVMASFAEWFGRDPELARHARWVALGGIGLSAGLLIYDLGRPERFLAMLRVFKPQSPMSMGVWILNAFGSTTTAAVLVDLLRQRYGSSLPVNVLAGGSKALSALFGLPFSNYTGVLIGATAIPVWHRNVKTLPIHFGASGVLAGVSILELLDHSENSALNGLAIGSALWETWEGAHLESRKEPELEPLKRGQSGWITRIGGLLSGPVSLGLRILASSSGKRRAKKLRRVAAVAGIAGSVLTRYGWMQAGHASVRRTAGTSAV